MAMNDNNRRKKFYDQLSAHYDLGSFEQFDSKMNDANSRRRLYDAINADGTYDIGTFDYFDEAMRPAASPAPASTGGWFGKINDQVRSFVSGGQQQGAATSAPAQEPSQTQAATPSEGQTPSILSATLSGPVVRPSVEQLQQQQDEKMEQLDPNMNPEMFWTEKNKKDFGDEIRTRLMARATPEQRRRMLEQQYGDEINKEFDKQLAEHFDEQDIARKKKQVEKMRQEYLKENLDYLDEQYQPQMEEVRQLEKEEDEQRKQQLAEYRRLHPEHDPEMLRRIDEAYAGVTSPEGLANKQKEIDYLRVKGIETRLADAQAREEELQRQMEADRKQYEEDVAAGRRIQTDNPMLYHAVNHSPNEDYYQAAIRQKRDEIRTINAELSDAGFLQGVIDAAIDPSFWSLGVSDVHTALALGDIKKSIDNGEDLTSAQRALLDATIAKQEAEEAYAGNRGFWYNAADVTVNAVPFVLEFIATGSGLDVMTAAGKSAGAALAKHVTSNLAKKAVQYTGTALGDIAAGFTMANTTGAARTWADIEQRHLGQVEKTDDGYEFVGGEDWGDAVRHGMVANTLEYYTEKLGAHLKIGKLAGKAKEKGSAFVGRHELLAKGLDKFSKGMEKVGLSKLSPVLSRIKASDFYQKGGNLLKQGGVHELPSEGIEEEANIILNSALVGDNKFSDLWDPKTQLDIWGGMAISIGFMRGIPLVSGAYQTAQYYRYKHKTDVSNSVAKYRLTDAKWAPIKERIDNAENKDFSSVMKEILSDPGLEYEEKKAVADYATNLLNMRGYNLATMAKAKDRIEKEGTGEEDPANVEAAADDAATLGYQQGYQAQSAAQRKQYADEASSAAERVKTLFDDADQKIIFGNVMTAEENLSYFLSHRGEYTDEQIAALADYYQKQARVDGMIDAVDNAVDLQVQDENARVRSNTHQGTGQVITARRGDEEFYVVGGDVASDEVGLDGTDGSNVTLTGTGGAVVVKNAQTGEVSVVSPQELTLTGVQDAQALMDYNETTLRQQLTQQAEDDMTYGEPANISFMQGDEVTLRDAEGNVIEGTVTMMPNTADGSYVVETADGQALEYTGDQLNRMVQTYNGQVVKASPNTSVTTNPSPNGEVNNQVEENMEHSGAVDNAGGEAGFNNETGGNEPSAAATETPAPGTTAEQWTVIQQAQEPVVNDDEAMPMIGEGEEAEPDFSKASSSRAHTYIYNEAGLTTEEADQFVDANKKEADQELEKLMAKPPKMGTDLAKYRKEKAEWQRKVAAAQQRANYWQEVKDRQEASVMAEQAGANEAPAAAPLEVATLSQQTEQPQQAGIPQQEEAIEMGEKPVTLTDEEAEQAESQPPLQPQQEGEVPFVENEGQQEKDKLYEAYENEQGTVDTEGGLVKDGVSERSLSASQRGALHALGRRIGKRVVIVSDEDLRKRGYDPRITQGFALGDTQYLSERFITKSDNYLSFVAGHELTHLIKGESPKVWKAYVDAVKAAMGEQFKKEFDRVKAVYDEAYDAYNAQHPDNPLKKLTDEEIEEEVCCDWAGNNMLTDEAAIRRVVEEASNAGADPASLIKKVLDWIDSFLESLRAAFRRGENVGDEIKNLETAKKLWQSMYDIAAARNNAAMKETTHQIIDTTTGAMENGGEIRHSISSIMDGAGLEAYETDDAGTKIPLTDKDGNVIVRLNGKTFDGHHLLTVEDLKSAKDSSWNVITNLALEIGSATQEKVDSVFQKYADIVNSFLVMGLEENGGAETMQDRWLWLGDTVFRTIAKNGDKQYSFSADITRVCKKNEFVIKAISDMQRKVGYGITPSQIMDIYLETYEQGYQVPCPVCYVFSRYIRNGKYATAAIEGMNRYGKHLPGGGGKTWSLDRWVQELAAIEQQDEEYKKLIDDASASLDRIPDQIDKLGMEMMRAGTTKARKAEIMKEVDRLDKEYRAALDLYAKRGMKNWIKSFVLQSNSKSPLGYTMRDDAKYPNDIADFNDCALDLRRTAETIGKYPAIQRLRKSGGSAAGKEITFASNNEVGEFLSGIGSGNPEQSVNVFSAVAQASTPKKKAKALDAARKRLMAAFEYAQRQSLRGGQRMWSWSDNIENLMPDVAINLMQLELLGGALQSYSKQLEGINLVARMGGYVNGSLMAKNNGWQELKEGEFEEKNGKLYLKEAITEVIQEPKVGQGTVERVRTLAPKGAPVIRLNDGKYYTLLLDDIIGVDPYGIDGKKGLFALNSELDKAGNIIVGMNDTHIRTCLADPRIFFVIPWHASGQSVHILRQMLSILGTDLREFVSTDYTNMQEERDYASIDNNGSEKKVPAKVVEIWESHNLYKQAPEQYPCALGDIKSGENGVVSQGQRDYRELRRKIFDGSIFEKGNEADLAKAQSDVFLSQVIRKIRERGLDSMTNTDNGYVYPYEYWDESADYDGADINGKRYAEYCRRLGIQPKFSGKLDGEKWTDEGNFIDDAGYWKLLIDRRMYDINGKFQDLTSVNSEGFSPKLIDPIENEKEFYISQVAQDNDVDGITNSVIAKEQARMKGELPQVNYDKSISKAAAEYQKASGNEMPRFSLSTEIESKYPNWMDNQTPETEGKRGQNTQVAGTVGTYKKVGKWVEDNMGKDAKILDASSGLGLGTLELRKQGFDVDDIEPYPGKERDEQPTYGGLGAYQRAMDDGKQYDYVISNAVLNVIPDDWRDGVLHDMAALMKPGGKMFINTRKAGEEKTIKNKIELESPQEVLVGSPEKITSYQRFFTPNELKEYVERELGDGYTVVIANEKNSGTKGLAAVVVTKNALDEEGRPRFSLTEEGMKEAQMDIISKSNPADESLGEHTWIRSVDDIKTFDEAMSEYGENENLTPDYTADMARKAKETGEITVYSSKPIDNGIFVTPSKMEAKNYAGEGKVYSKKVRTSDVAWIDGIQGQYAKVEGSQPKFSVSDTPFYSNAERAVEGIKQEKATPEQWLKMIEKNGGLKAGEDKWMGLSEWLKEKSSDNDAAKKTLTKQEVMDFIRQNQIRVEEVPYGGTERAAQDKDYESLSVESLPEAMREPMRKLNERWKALYQEARKDADSPMQARNAAFVQLREEYGRDFATYFASRSADQLVVRNPFYLKEAAKMLGVEAEIDNPINPTRLNYTTEGLENKREIALVVPTVEPWNKGDDIHFGDAGDGRAVAWVRFGETTDKDGNKVLVIDEIQSKRHQEGRENGYRTDEFKKVDSRIKELEEKGELSEEERKEYRDLMNRMGDMLKENPHPVPDAPFEKNWHELAMKRMLRYAAENGYDKVAWTKGAQQAERYNLGGSVKNIQSYINDDGTRHVMMNFENGGGLTCNIDSNGTIVSTSGHTQGIISEGMSLNDVVGKELGQKIVRGEGEVVQNRFVTDREVRELSGNNLRIGGEGMKGFYDQILPRFMDKYGKKWGVKTGEVELPNVEEAGRKMWSVDVTPEMKESVMQGQPMFSLNGKNRNDANNSENKETLNNKYEGEDSHDLFLSLSQKEGDELYEGVNELADRVLRGEARIARLGEEMEPGRRTLAHVVGSIISGRRLGRPESTHETLGRSVQEGALEASGPEAKAKDNALDKEEVLEWARRTGHYFDENTVKEESIDKALFGSGAESHVYRKQGGEKVIKFFSVFIGYEHALLKHLDDIALFTQNLPHGYDVVGFSEDANGNLAIVMEQDFVDGDTAYDYFGNSKDANAYIDKYLEKEHEPHLSPKKNDEGDIEYHYHGGLRYNDIHSNNVIVDNKGNAHVIDGQVERIEDHEYPRYGSFDVEDNVRFSLNSKPKRTPKQERERQAFAERQWRRAHERVKDWGEKLAITDKITSVDSIDDLPGADKLPDTKRRSKGWYDPVNDNIVIVLGNHNSPVDVERTLLRESVARYGLRKLFGDSFDTFLDNVYNSASREIRKEIKTLSDTKYRGDLRMATEEYLARLAEDTNFKLAVDSGWWKNIKDWFLNMLKELGLPGFEDYFVELTDSELRYILWRSYENLYEPGRYRNVFQAAKDIQMQQQLGTGRFEKARDVAMVSQQTEQQENEQQDGRAAEAEEVGQPKFSVRANMKDREDIHTISDTINDYNRSLLKPDEHANWLQQMMRREWRKYNGGRLREAWQDSMLALKRGQDIIAKHSGKPIKDYEDAYTLENLSHGRAKNEYEWFDRNLYKPMIKSFWRLQKALGMKAQDVHKYLFCKHGLERNVQMAFRDAVNKKVLAAQKKYKEDLKKWMAQNAGNATSTVSKPVEPQGALEIHKAYREDADRIANEEAWKEGRISYDEYRAVDDAIRERYAPDYSEFREKDYAGLTGLFATEHVASDGTKVTDYPELADAERMAAKEVQDVESKPVGRSSGTTAKALCDQLWDDINACTKWTLLKSYQSGQMSKDMYEYVRDMYDYYIPLRGWDGTNAQDVYDYVGGRAGVFSKSVIPAKGRTSVADNPIAYIGNMAMSGIVIGQKSMVKQRLLNLARNHKSDLLTVQGAWYQNVGTDDDPIWQAVSADIPEDATPQEVADIIDAFERRMEELKKDGKATQQRADLNIVYPAPASQLKEHEIRVTENGKEYVIYVNGDPRLAQAVNGTRQRKAQEGHTGFINELAARSGRFKAAVYTSFSPAFVFSNFARDITMAIASSLISKGPQYNLKAAKNTLALMNPLNKNNIFNLMWKYTNGKLDMRSSTQRMFQEFMTQGAETGFIAQLDLESFKKGINKELGRQNQSIVNPKRWLRGYLQVVEFLNRSIEDSTRFIVYKTSRQEGESAQRAARDAKDVTLNFNRKGTGELGNAFARGAFIFVNPAIQGIQTIFRLAKGHPFKFTAITSGFVLGGTIQPYLNAILMQLLSGSDDDDYWKLPEHVRRQCLCIYVGDGDFITIPLAQEFRSFWGIGEQVAARTMGHGKDNLTDEGMDIVESFLDLLPLDLMGHGVREAKFLSHDWWVGMGLNFTPDIFKTEIESLANKDFTGRPIYRENEYNKHLPEWAKAFKGTPEFIVKSTELLNALTGGEGSWKSGWADVNPGVLFHELSGWVGGPFTFSTTVVNTATKLFDGDEVNIYDIPVLNRFLNSPSDRETKGGLPQSYWKMYNEEWKPMEQTVSEMKRQAKSGNAEALSSLEQFFKSDDYAKYQDMERQVNDATLMRQSATSGDSFDATEAQRADTPDARYKSIRNGKDAFEDWCMDEIATHTGKYKQELDAMIKAHSTADDIRAYRLDNALELEARRAIEETRKRFNTYKNMLGKGHDDEWLRRLRRERDELLRVYRFDDFFRN